MRNFYLRFTNAHGDACWVQRFFYDGRGDQQGLSLVEVKYRCVVEYAQDGWFFCGEDDSEGYRTFHDRRRAVAA